MKKLVAKLVTMFVLLSLVCTPVFAAEAGDEEVVFADLIAGLSESEVTSLVISHTASNSNWEYTLKETEYIEILLGQLKNMQVEEEDAGLAENLLKSGRQANYEITLTAGGSALRFTIVFSWLDDTSALFIQLPDSTSVSHVFSDIDSAYSWLSKTEKIAKISQSQETNIPLADNSGYEVYLQVGDIPVRLYFDAQPKLVDDRMMVPVRNIAEAVGIVVEWDGEKQQVTLRGEHATTMKIGSTKLVFSGLGVSDLDVAPFIENGRTYVPLRFISEDFAKNVDYDQSSRRILISDKLQNGKIVDLAHNYTIEVFRDYEYGNTGTSYSAFTMPLDLEGISRPVKSGITAGRMDMTYEEALEKLREEYQEKDEYAETAVSGNEHMIRFRHTWAAETDVMRTVVIYVKKDGDTALFVGLDCHTDYFAENENDLMNNITTISPIVK